jgi:hypothetical protein
MRNRWKRVVARRRVLAEAFGVVLLVRLGLAVVPITVWQRLSERLLRRAREARRSGEIPADIAWAVRRASRAVPGATCLTQSLSAQIVLARHGHASRLQIGVARTGTRELRAHAWLESDERILVGARVRDTFTPLYSSTMTQ